MTKRRSPANCRHTTLSKWGAVSVCSCSNIASDWHRPSRWRERPDQERYWINEAGVRPDARVAYMWLSLPRIGHTEAYFEVMRADLRKTEAMQEKEIAEAMQMVKDWQSSDCPSPMHRTELRH